MAEKNIVIAGATFNSVPSIDISTSGGGSASFVEVSDTTAVASDVAQGKYFYTAAGVKTAGTASGAVVQPLSVTQNGTYNPPSGVDGYAPVTVNVSGQTSNALSFDFLKIGRGTPRWDSGRYVLDSNQNRLGSNISTISFKAGDVIDIGDFETYKFAIGTNNASTSAHSQVWIAGGYITSPYTLLQADIADMKCLMIARVDNANMTDADIQYIQTHGTVMRGN